MIRSMVISLRSITDKNKPSTTFADKLIVIYLMLEMKIALSPLFKQSSEEEIIDNFASD